MIGIVIIRRLFGNGGDGNGDAGDRTAGAGAIACGASQDVDRGYPRT